MTTQKEFLKRLVSLLDRAGIPYMVTGSMGSILSKLEWMKGCASDVQYSDALGVAVAQWENLDLDYLRRWAGELGVESILARLMKEAREQAERTR